MHEGHRNRLREKVKKFGMNVLEKHELLELDLFYIIPVRNTNDIAYRLLERFGSLKNIFSASVEDLCLVEGVGKKTAMFLKMQGYIHNILLQEQVDPEENCDNSIENVEIVSDIINCRLFGLEDECLLLILGDRQRRINYVEIICEGTLETISIDIPEMMKIVSNNNARYAIIAHNHLSGMPLPSRCDVETTKQIKQALSLINVTLLDHIVVADKQQVSMSEYNLF